MSDIGPRRLPNGPKCGWRHFGVNLMGTRQMPRQITRRLKPEEEEILRKREELATVRATLAERELELVDLRSQLASFEGRYLRQVGALYAELDEWKARISELRAKLDPSASAREQAQQARDQARQTYDDAHSKASETQDFIPAPELRSLYREVAKRIHPDFSKDSGDLERRTRFMAEANRAYEAGDAEALQRILDEYQEGADDVEGEGIGAELIRIIRQISLAKDRVTTIERELAALRQSEIALLKKQAEEREHEGRDLLAELATSIREQIELTKKEYESLAKEEVRPT
jgi:chromosome segregation ATPase